MAELTTTSATSAADTGTDTDSGDLASFGYQQQLHRKLGSYASFAAGFSFVSILTTVFQLFGFGFSFGGPAFFWTWPMVFLGQIAVALTFAEMSARYPIAGCIYQWSRRVSTELVGWFAGWLMLLGQIVSVAAAAIALQVVLPSIWSGFQLVGGSPDLTTITGSTNAILLAGILITGTTVVNVLGVRLMSLINSIGVTCELAGVALLVVLLLFHAKRGPAVVFDTGTTATHGSYLWPFLVSALMAAYVMYGFDSAGELSEETKAPRRTAPRAILRALYASGLGGALLLVAALLAAPSVTDGNLATGGLPYVLTSSLGSGLGTALLVDVAIAIIVCTLAIQTAASRMVFSMSRDRVLPGSRVLGRISPRTGTPVLPSIVVGVLAMLVLLINLGQTQIFTAVTSVAVVLVYLAYLLVTGPVLVARLRGRLPAARAEHFSLGRWAVPVNVVAVLWGIGMAVNIAWPRASVYDPAGTHWYLRYFALLVLAAVLVIGALGYLRRRVPAQPVSPDTAGVFAGE
ncbi:MAG TPA: amino acid permease [Pseudonocardiaceae bacterium]|jgi:urea carboxylase system permease|nr:amino acid permease [Pseudonocardiaceae bacterium]